MAGLFGGGEAIVAKIGDPPKEGYTDILVDRSTFFGNEFRLGKYTRYGAISKFTTRAETLMQIKGEFRKRVLELKARCDAGENLRFLCHCHPQACHASWYAGICTGRIKVPIALHKQGTKLKISD